MGTQHRLCSIGAGEPHPSSPSPSGSGRRAPGSASGPPATPFPTSRAYPGPLWGPLGSEGRRGRQRDGATPCPSLSPPCVHGNIGNPGPPGIPEMGHGHIRSLGIRRIHGRDPGMSLCPSRLSQTSRLPQHPEAPGPRSGWDAENRDNEPKDSPSQHRLPEILSFFSSLGRENTNN